MIEATNTVENEYMHRMHVRSMMQTLIDGGSGSDEAEASADDLQPIEYRGYTISPRWVTNNTEGGLRYTRYVILRDGKETTPPAAALSLRSARQIIDTMICRDKIDVELAERVRAAVIACAVPEVREHISNARKLGRRDLSEGLV